MRGGDLVGSFTHNYQSIISVENLLEAWREFLRGKRKKIDVQEFGHNLMDNVLDLHKDLKNKTYVHGSYHAFNISDPKPRNIHKASVRDRLLHHAIYRKLYPYFDKKFIYASYSCRIGKGTHKATQRFRKFSFKVSKNHTETCWILKCDIRKFFASIDQDILMNIIARDIDDQDTINLLNNIVRSFNAGTTGKGLPLGNLTSQLLVNIYMNEFDQFTKHTLKAKHYVRYADDFVFLSCDKLWLKSLIPQVADYLKTKLSLSLHPRKVQIITLASGVDFLGWIHFSDHSVLRTTTKRKMLHEIKVKDAKEETVQAYLGLLSHGNARKLQAEVEGVIEKLPSKE